MKKPLNLCGSVKTYSRPLFIKKIGGPHRVRYRSGMPFLRQKKKKYCSQEFLSSVLFTKAQNGFNLFTIKSFATPIFKIKNFFSWPMMRMKMSETISRTTIFRAIFLTIPKNNEKNGISITSIERGILGPRWRRVTMFCLLTAIWHLAQTGSRICLQKLTTQTVWLHALSKAEKCPPESTAY